ncbi:MAG: hypothetical protein NC311_15045 [Muribaculaceae bacterium]|nr:hypothetical protein [Muribaculaceae bacterium]
MRKSTLSGITGLLLAGVLAAGVCCAGYASRNADGKWFKNSDISSWHWSDNSQADKDDDGNGEINTSVPVDGMTVSAVKSNGIKIRSMPMTASNGNTDSTYYLSATVEPADADEQELIWSVEFKTSSGWSNGKNASSYVSVSPTSDTHNAIVTCLSDFGEPIIVVVRSKDNPDASAYCTCDYVKRVKSLSLSVADPSFTNSFGYTYDIEPTAYTIDSDFSITDIKMEVAFNFLYDMKNKIGDSVFSEICYVPTGGVSLIVDNQNKKLSIVGNEPSALFTFSDWWSDEDNEYTVSAEEMLRYKALANSTFRKTVKEYTGKHATLKLSYSITYNGQNYGNGSVTTDVNFNYNTIKVPVSNVKLNNGNIIF